MFKWGKVFRNGNQLNKMEQNPLSEQIKINTAKEELKNSLERLFDNPRELDSNIDKFILRLESYQRGGLVFDKEGIVKGVRESVNIKDRQTSISHLLKVLEPFIIIKATQPEIFEKIGRQEILSKDGNLKLSEVLFAGLGEEDETLIHLLPATEFIKKEGIGNFKKEIINGLIKLAELIKSYPNIKRVYAISWIVAKNPLLLEKLGFIIVGDISEEERKEHFLEENRPIAKAFMTREDLLAKYGK